MHFSDKMYDGFVDLVIYWHEGDDEITNTQVLKADNAQPYALRKLLCVFQYLIRDVNEMEKDKFYIARFIFDKERHVYKFQSIEKIEGNGNPILYLH